MKNKLSLEKILHTLSPEERLTGLIALLLFLLVTALVGRGIIPQLSQLLGFIIIVILALLLLVLALFAKKKRHEAGYRKFAVDDWGFNALRERKYPPSLVFLEDEVFIKYLLDENAYNILFHKKVLNNGKEPLAKIYARIAVNVFPDNPKEAREYYRKNPLEMHELDFKAYDNNDLELDYELEFDCDSNKEIFIFFGSKGAIHPVYPGEERDIYYKFTISTKKWGPFIERNIRTETKKCRIVLDFPDALQMNVWGIERSITKGEVPLMPGINIKQEVGFTRYEWVKDDPSLYSRYRIRWKFPDIFESQ